MKINLFDGLLRYQPAPVPDANLEDYLRETALFSSQGSFSSAQTDLENSLKFPPDVDLSGMPNQTGEEADDDDREEHEDESQF